MKKPAVSLLLILVLCAMALPVQAQDAPADVLEKAIAAVQQALNRSDRPERWVYVIEHNIHNSDLGCPLTEGSNVDQPIRVYAFTLSYDGVGYDVRVSSDASLVQLCDTAFNMAAPDPGAPAQPATGERLAVPAAAWWAVLVNETSRTLHWVNPNGEFTVMPWPVLPNQDPTWTPNMMLSPDGRYLVIVGTLTNGNNSIGFYDMQTGQFTQTHTAQPGEVISRLQRYAFDPSGERVVVGFRGADDSWRVIVFELATGNAVAQLASTHPDVTAALSGQQVALAAPVPFYVIESGGMTMVHIQLLIPVDAPEQLPAIQWRVPPLVNTTEEVVASPLTYPLPNMMPDTRAMITYVDPSVPLAQSPAGPPRLMHNAVGMAGLFDMEPLYTTGEMLVSAPNWGADGQLISFMGRNPSGIAHYWFARGSTTLNQFVAPPQNAIGINEGLLWQDEVGTLYLQRPTNLQPELIYAPASGAPRLIWALSPDRGLAVTSLPASGAANAPVVPAPGTGCPGAPVSRLAVNMTARVSYTGTPLRLRDAPGGAWLQDLANGTVVTVIGGPQCVDTYAWWQLRLADGTMGWSAEGDPDEYFLEPAS